MGTAATQTKFFDLSAQVDGSATVFVVKDEGGNVVPYVPGSLRVWLTGEMQKPGAFFTEDDPVLGTFTTSEPPDQYDELQVRVEIGEGELLMVASGIDPLLW